MWWSRDKGRVMMLKVFVVMWCSAVMARGDAAHHQCGEATNQLITLGIITVPFNHADMMHANGEST